MLDDRSRAILAGLHTAVLTTLNPDGSPQSTPLWYVAEELDDELVVWMSARTGRQKCLNLARDPRASLVVVDAEAPQHYVELRGTVTLSEDPDYAVRDRVVRKHGWEDGNAFDPPGTLRTGLRLSVKRVLGR